MKQKPKKINPAVLAVQAMGTQEKLAHALKRPVTRQCIGMWVKRGRIPLSRVREVSAVTGIPKSLLSPDFAD